MTNPLFGRLQIIQEFIQRQTINQNFSILCIQEIRLTKSNNITYKTIIRFYII
jgi:hypothetical protein